MAVIIVDFLLSVQEEIRERLEIIFWPDQEYYDR